MNGKVRILVLSASFAAAALALSPPAARAAGESPRLPDVAANDNTVAGGRLDRGVLHISLVARRGLFYPDGPGTMGLPIEAFGEAGKPLQIPGPFVHVPVGTRVDATLRNDLNHPLTVRGLASPEDRLTSFVRIAPGQTRHVSFVLDRAGAFGYYGADHGGLVDSRLFDDAESSGAIVVEKPHGLRLDHAFVLALYTPIKQKDGSPNFVYALVTINGRSFPATERLTYERGQRVRWAVFNASPMNHPMHLHGFYFRLERPDAYDQVTHAFVPGEAELLSWTADRAGQLDVSLPY